MPKSNIDQNRFYNIISDLKDYGRKGHEEINFVIDKGQVIPTTTARPHWFFRLIRWLFGKGYQHSKACEKTVKFLEENRALLLGKSTEVTQLNNQFSKLTGKGERSAINAQFSRLFQLLDEDQLEEEEKTVKTNIIETPLDEDEKTVKTNKIETLSNGTVLDGDFVDEYLVNGTKTIDLGDNTVHVYKGTFNKNKLIDGEKILNDSKYKISFKGTFDDDERLIKGTKASEAIDGSYVNLSEGKFEKDRLIEGRSTTTFPDGREIISVGIFDNILEFLIFGTKTHSTGTVEAGTFTYLKLKQGTKTLSDKTVMEGEFDCDLLKGKGKITYPDGKIEKGNFRFGVLDKPVKSIKTHTLFDGSVFEREFEGNSIINTKKTTKNGTILEGKFKDFKLVEGTQTTQVSFPNNEFLTALSTGTFDDDEFLIDGEKTITIVKQQKKTIEHYTGKFNKGGLMDGTKIKTLENGTHITSTGIFNSDKLVNGKHSSSKGIVREGEFDQDERLKKGKYTNTLGDTFEGEFVKGKPHGTITFTSHNSSSPEIRIYENGVLKDIDTLK